MALPVLDGNQTATTLSSVVTGGEHIVAHSVVSLGSTAIANITSAVSGSVISISNFPATQTVAGTVTANVPLSDISGGIADYISGTDSFVVSPLGGVTFPISGTVTANVFGRAVSDSSEPQFRPIPLIGYDEGIENADRPVVVPVQLTNTNGSILNEVPISGTVTVGNLQTVTAGSLLVNTTKYPTALVGYDGTNGTWQPVPLSENGECVRIGNGNGTFGSINPLPISGTITVGNSVTIGSVPNGSLTTRFGTPTTANTAFATAAVTKSDRKYLLIQNVTTGSNVITVGIGFTPTTTQGIQLTAGAGITFESSYIPTGAVYVLSSVTASNFTILEA